MKGYDCDNRFFVVFKATVYFEDGNIKEYFTTFFQRWSGDLTYLPAGNYEKLLFTIDRDAKLEQVLFLIKLFENKEVNKGEIVRINGQIYADDLFPSEDQSRITSPPILVRLGWASEIQII